MNDEEAVLWMIRTRDPDFADWEAFTLWLERDPAHAAAYDALADADSNLHQILPSRSVFMPAPPANDPGRHSRRPWRWVAGAAVAAALVGVISLDVLNRSDIYSVTTRPGETRTIALDDGTRVEMNGGTSMRFDRHNARFAALDIGEAAFIVRHDAANPFRVTVGDDMFEDAGTVFNIVRTGSATRIGVAEGKVIYNPKAEAITLTAGRALQEDAAGLRLMAVAPQSVASWRQGSLIYANASVAEIGEEIGRSLGVSLAVTPSAGAQRFTGTIRLDKDPARFFAGAAPLMGLSAVRQGNGWVLKEGNGTPR
jgi:transmembrane sensor